MQRGRMRAVSGLLYPETSSPKCGILHFAQNDGGVRVYQSWNRSKRDLA